jgi:alpha-beta hydrolase superfamily lysophospholipase
MPHTVRFHSKDDLPVTADLYLVPGARGCMLLCHRSHFNRGEYRETAEKLNRLGFACMAIDQRSGMNVLGVVNETYSEARRKGLKTGYLDAKPDIEAAIDYAYSQNGRRPVILVGSSYSASLALLIAVRNPRVKSVIAFSPGDYIKGNKLAESLRDFAKPVYVTSAKKEIAETTRLLKHVSQEYLTQYKPKAEGAHGSRVLWSKTVGNEEYWESLTKFLNDSAGQ